MRVSVGHLTTLGSRAKTLCPRDGPAPGADVLGAWAESREPARAVKPETLGYTTLVWVEDSEEFRAADEDHLTNLGGLPTGDVVPHARAAWGKRTVWTWVSHIHKHYTCADTHTSHTHITQYTWQVCVHIHA